MTRIGDIVTFLYQDEITYGIVSKINKSYFNIDICVDGDNFLFETVNIHRLLVID